MSCVGDVSSDFVHLLSGVVQDSGLGPGPLIFVLYIDELAEILRTYGVTVRLFPTTLKCMTELRILKPVDAAVLQTAVNRLVDWAESWQLIISIAKCNYIIVGKQTSFNIDV